MCQKRWIWLGIVALTSLLLRGLFHAQPAVSAGGVDDRAVVAAAALAGVPAAQMTVVSSSGFPSSARPHEHLRMYRLSWLSRSSLPQSGSLIWSTDRRYVAEASLWPDNATSDGVVAPDELMEATARSLASRAFPGWPARRTLTKIPTASIGSRALYEWRDGDADRTDGSSVLIAIDPRGARPYYYSAYWPPSARIAGRLARADALSAFVRYLAGVPRFDDLVVTDCRLAEASPLAPGEGPVWQLRAARRVAAPDPEPCERFIGAVIDAVSGEIVLPRQTPSAEVGG